MATTTKTRTRKMTEPQGVAVIVGSKRSINKIDPDPTRTIKADRDVLGNVAPGMTILVTEDYAEELVGFGLAHYPGVEG